MDPDFEGFEFVAPIEEEYFEEVIVHLRNSFFADEPLNKSVNLCKPGEPHSELENHSLITLRDKLSIMVLDCNTGEVSIIYLQIHLYILPLIKILYYLELGNWSMSQWNTQRRGP
jgi:hypothetical protein